MISLQKITKLWAWKQIGEMLRILNLTYFFTHHTKTNFLNSIFINQISSYKSYLYHILRFKISLLLFKNSR